MSPYVSFISICTTIKVLTTLQVKPTEAQKEDLLSI